MTKAINQTVGVCINISIVAGHAGLMQELNALLESAPQFRCLGSHRTAEIALQEIPREKSHVVLIDMNLPDGRSRECMRKLKLLMPETEVIAMAVYQNTEKIFQAHAAGASSCLLLRNPAVELLDSIAAVHMGMLSMNSDVARRIMLFFPNGRHEGRTQVLLSDELAVLSLLARGYSCMETAERLGLARAAVFALVRGIYKKFHACASREHAATRRYGRILQDACHRLLISASR
jgi:two-component system response regulator NreC